ncbi:MAG: peroxiredoxin [Myxococcota bacterium]
MSIDDNATSASWAKRKGFSFRILADPGMKLMAKTYTIRSPFEPDLPLHSTYIIGEGRATIYRKNGGGRPKVRELLDAIDYFRATHP